MPESSGSACARTVHQSTHHLPNWPRKKPQYRGSHICKPLPWPFVAEYVKKDWVFQQASLHRRHAAPWMCWRFSSCRHLVALALVRHGGCGHVQVQMLLCCASLAYFLHCKEMIIKVRNPHIDASYYNRYRSVGSHTIYPSMQPSILHSATPKSIQNRSRNHHPPRLPNPLRRLQRLLRMRFLILSFQFNTFDS